MKANFEKLMISARYWLQGMSVVDQRYIMPLEVMEMARQHHNGFRNGGEPEFIHQLRIFHYLRTLHSHLKNPWMVYSLGFGHDMIEDPNQETKKYISPNEIEDRWGKVLVTKLLMMSKEVEGVKNLNYSLEKIFADVDTGPAKGADRVDNLSSMVGVFKRPRLERYINETEQEFLPLLKPARRAFPYQEGVYENIKLQMVNQLQLAKKVAELEITIETLQSAAVPKATYDQSNSCG